MHQTFWTSKVIAMFLEICALPCPKRIIPKCHFNQCCSGDLILTIEPPSSLNQNQNSQVNINYHSHGYIHDSISIWFNVAVAIETPKFDVVSQFFSHLQTCSFCTPLESSGHTIRIHQVRSVVKINGVNLDNCHEPLRI